MGGRCLSHGKSVSAVYETWVALGRLRLGHVQRCLELCLLKLQGCGELGELSRERIRALFELGLVLLLQALELLGGLEHLSVMGLAHLSNLLIKLLLMVIRDLLELVLEALDNAAEALDLRVAAIDELSVALLLLLQELFETLCSRLLGSKRILERLERILVKRAIRKRLSLGGL